MGLGKGKAPDMASHCDPGVGVMDTAGKKWVIGDTFLRRYYSIFDDDRGMVGFVRSLHPDEAIPMPRNTTTMPVTEKTVMAAAPCLMAPSFPGHRRIVRA